MAKFLMVQGTSSSAGKSLLVTALCRILKQDGWKVAPFKAQNMSLNSSVTPDGGEIGRAQAVQAEAAGVEPKVEMNPILLKPEAENRSQVVVLGKPLGGFGASGYFSLRERLWPVVTASLERLAHEHEIVVIEGAGSPAEVNLKPHDLVNMRVALHCRAPVLLLADIDRGGMFASLIGTLELLEPEERELVRALVVNKFRGDLTLLQPGLSWLEERTGRPVAGVLPYFDNLGIAEEDSVALERRRALKAKTDFALDIAVIGLPHISNFDDFDPLEEEQGVRLRYVEPGDRLGEPDMIVLPGTKSTIADLARMRERGLAREILARARAGTPVIGICGGYQMLGEEILDPERVESAEPRARGLGLLPVRTRFFATKCTRRVRGRVALGHGLLERAEGLFVEGYEIHMGETPASRGTAPFAIEERAGRPCRASDGCVSSTGLVLGTYIHGLFHNHAFRHALLQALAARRGISFHSACRIASRDERYDRLADLVRRSLRMELIYRILREAGRTGAP
jgi:adenosylcobyric acid synthase